jgi:hypothetical protein
MSYACILAFLSQYRFPTSFIHPVISFPPPSSSFTVKQEDVIQNRSPYEQNEQLCFLLPCFDVVSEVSASSADFLIVWRRLHVRATC